jgi:UDP-N-acetylglucosamine 2-epimerase (non-hydrolysing)
MNIVIVYGTRPEFLKLKVLIDKFKKQNINLTVLRINQHPAYKEDEGYYDHLLDIENISENRLSNIGINILKNLPKYIENATHVLSQGDTASCFYSLLCGYQMKKICIHLEAGMRTYDLDNPYPEEGYREMISRITNIHLCPSEIEKEFLLNEKVISKDIYVVGNTILDLVNTYDIKLTQENIIIITLHRRENWDEYRTTIRNLNLLISKYNNIKFYFLTHPNPSLKNIILEENMNLDNLEILESLSHKELILLLSKCNCVITDSGGIQEEANYLGKYLYILREITERNAISKNNYQLINNNDLLTIDLNKLPSERGYEYGDGNAVDKILNIL